MSATHLDVSHKPLKVPLDSAQSQREGNGIETEGSNEVNSSSQFDGNCSPHLSPIVPTAPVALPAPAAMAPPFFPSSNRAIGSTSYRQHSVKTQSIDSDGEYQSSNMRQLPPVFRETERFSQITTGIATAVGLASLSSSSGDQKVWTVSGKMPGFVSKKFVHDYKYGRYKKLQSLRGDMDFLNSPHHEQKHLGNSIFPYQAFQKTFNNAAGSFDFRQIDALQHQQLLPRSCSINAPNNSSLKKEKINSPSPSKLNSPSTSKQQTTSNPNNVWNVPCIQQQQQQLQQQKGWSSNPSSPPSEIVPQQQLEIRYIDIISQPLVKSAVFVDKMSCSHGMTNFRNTPRKSFFNSPGDSSLYTPQIAFSTKRLTGAVGGGKSQNIFNIKEEQLKERGYTAEVARKVQQQQQQQQHTQTQLPVSLLGSNSSKGLLDRSESCSFFTLQPKTISLQTQDLGGSNNIFHSHLQRRSRSVKEEHPGEVEATNQAKKFAAVKRRVSQHQPPNFASSPDKIALLSRAKQSLVKYVNEIGVKDNPLVNTFVGKRKFL